MAPVFRKFTKRVFIVINIVLCILFLLACCNSFRSAAEVVVYCVTRPYLSFPPYSRCSILSFSGSFSDRDGLCFPLVVLLLGYTNIRALIGFHYGKEVQKQKPEGSLRILTWNVSWFDEQLKADKSQSIVQDENA